MIFAVGTSTHPDPAAPLRDSQRAFARGGALSGVVNLLMLAGPLYMLRIYDRS
jgi:ABC-type protease/lipase transport system fused ATPase/permease subunit